MIRRSEPELSIGLVGCGRWGGLILRDLLATGVGVHVADVDPARRAIARVAGAASVCAGASELPEVDGFVVATPTTAHAASIAALRGGARPIFVEKPLTSDVASARRLVETFGDRLFVMDKWRYHPGVEALAAQARSGVLGDILAIRTYRLGWDQVHDDVDSVWILLPHDLSIVLEILGSLPPARSAFAPTPAKPGTDLIGVLQDDEGTLRVTVEISTNHPYSWRGVVVVGSEASAQLNGDQDRQIQIASGKPGRSGYSVQRVEVGSDLPLQLELQAFVSYLKGGREPRSSAAQGLAIVERVSALRALAGLQ